MTHKEFKRQILQWKNAYLASHDGMPRPVPLFLSGYLRGLKNMFYDDPRLSCAVITKCEKANSFITSKRLGASQHVLAGPSLTKKSMDKDIKKQLLLAEAILSALRVGTSL